MLLTILGGAGIGKIPALLISSDSKCQMEKNEINCHSKIFGYVELAPFCADRRNVAFNYKAEAPIAVYQKFLIENFAF